MAPAADTPANRHPSTIEVARSYVSQSALESKLSEINMGDSKDDMLRLQGVAWIDAVRRSLQLPIRTYNTAAVYFHRFRLRHPENEYNWADASAAALFTACKIEDTLKKSKDILCANYNSKLAPAEQLAPDDMRFEAHAKLIIGLERLMLEASAFDFRNRYPQKVLVKLCKAVGMERESEARTAWHLSLDLYRTFAPLKQSTSTMAIACVELAARLHRDEKDAEGFLENKVLEYRRWSTSRQEVMGMFETICGLGGRLADETEQKRCWISWIFTRTTASKPSSGLFTLSKLSSRSVSISTKRRPPQTSRVTPLTRPKSRSPATANRTPTASRLSVPYLPAHRLRYREGMVARSASC